MSGSVTQPKSGTSRASCWSSHSASLAANFRCRTPRQVRLRWRSRPGTRPVTPRFRVVDSEIAVDKDRQSQWRSGGRPAEQTEITVAAEGPEKRRTLDRRSFLSGGAALVGGAVLLEACGSSSSTQTTTTTTRPPLSKEPNKLSILEWGGYEADGTKAQVDGLLAGKDYTAKYGGNSITYTYIINDDQALEKATSDGPFDIMHPCHENIPDYVARGLVQPWDTSLLSSFDQLNPYLVSKGKIDGKQYMIP